MRRLTRLVLVGIAGCLVAALAACSSPPATLHVQILDLPTATEAIVTIDGPTGFHQLVTRSTTLSVTAGSYQFRATPVSASSNTYAAAPNAGSITIRAGTNATLSVDYADVIPGTTKVLQLSPGASPIVSPTSITLPASSPDRSSLNPGDVVVLGVTPDTPDGLIRKVVSVAASPGSSRLQTAPATLRDAIPRGRFTIRAQIGPPHSRTIVPAARTLTVSTQSAPITARLLDQGTSQATTQGFDWNGACSVSGALKEDAYFNLRPFVDFEVDWGFFSVNRVVLKAGLDQDAGASITATAAARCNFDGSTPTLALGQIEFSIGFVPIVITPELSGSGNINGTTTAHGALGATEAFTLDAGFVYDHGNLNFLHDASPNVSWTPSIEPEAAASMEAGPMLRFDVDGLGGPDIELRFAIEAAADQSGAIIVGSVGLGAGIHLGFLGFSVDQDSGDILRYEKTLAQWGVPPTLSTTPTPTPSLSGTITISGGTNAQLTGPPTSCLGPNTVEGTAASVDIGFGDSLYATTTALGRITLGSNGPPYYEVTFGGSAFNWLAANGTPTARPPTGLTGSGTLVFTSTGGSIDAVLNSGSASIQDIHVVGQWTCAYASP